MKIQAISILLFFMVTTVSKAQLYNNGTPQSPAEVPLESYFNGNEPKHAYYKDVNSLLNKYLGTWVYDDGTNYFKVKFIKQIKFRFTPSLHLNKGATIYTDRIIGFYEYKKNGVPIYNTFSQQNIFDPGHEIKISSNFGSFTPWGFEIDFKESINHTCGSLLGMSILTYSNNGTEILTWNRTNYVGSVQTCTGDRDTDRELFQIPANMTLTKIAD